MIIVKSHNIFEIISQTKKTRKASFIWVDDLTYPKSWAV